jgi:hypothetical protein
MKGRLIITLQQASGAAFVYASADVMSTGSAPTVSNVLTTQSAAGTISAAATPFVLTGGECQLQIVNSGAAITIKNLSVVFKGEFYN